MTYELQRLHQRAVVLNAVDGSYPASALEVVHALSRCLRVPRFNIRASKHRPEDFLVNFDGNDQKEAACRLSHIIIGGTTFSISP